MCSYTWSKYLNDLSSRVQCACVCRIPYCMINHPSSLPRLRGAAHLIRSASHTSTASTHCSTTWSWSERSTAPWLATAEILKLPKVPGEKIYIHVTYFNREEKSIFKLVHLWELMHSHWCLDVHTEHTCACTVCTHIHKLIQSWPTGSIKCVVQIMYLCLCVLKGGWKLVFV